MKRVFFVFSAVLLLIFFFSCKNEPAVQFPEEPEPETTTLEDTITSKDQMAFFTFQNVLLGDGVPLTIELAIRWKITDAEQVLTQFNTVYDFQRIVLRPRAKELVSQVFNEFNSVDSVFSSQRQEFIGQVKERFYEHLGEDGIFIKEVICSHIHFPKTYTDAMEQAGLQRQELERINQEKLIAIAKAEAERSKAEANAKVEIAKAKAEDRVEKIKAETEKNRRQSMLESAETKKQIALKQTQSDAERKKLLAKVDLEKERDIKKLEIQHKRELVEVEVEKKKKMDIADFEVQMELAKVFQDNPIYASYLVNKELASKVQIAVLPNGSDPNVFGGLLQQTIPVGGKGK